MAYSEGQKLAALKLYLAHVPITEIVQRKATGNPSEVTFHDWKKKGILTDGVPWDQYRDEQEKQDVVDSASREAARAVEPAKAERLFYEDALSTLKQVYGVVEHKALGGEMKFTVADMETLLRLIGTLENQSADKIRFAKQFVREVFAVVLEIMDAQQFARLQLRLAALQERTFKELMPHDYAVIVNVQAEQAEGKTQRSAAPTQQTPPPTPRAVHNADASPEVVDAEIVTETPTSTNA